jgi:hypothetical protein
MQIPARQNCIRVGTQTILAKDVKDKLDRGPTEGRSMHVMQAHQGLSGLEIHAQCDAASIKVSYPDLRAL